ncbi:MAG: glycosyltransferase family 4 protein [Chloroflexota bacterium]
MTDKPRLLYLVNIPRFFVTHRLPLARAARDAGYDVHVATASGDETNIDIIRAEGFPFHPLPLSQHGMNPLQELRTLAAIIRLYRDLRPDLVHMVTIKAVIYGGIGARLARIPALVYAITGLGYLYSESGLKVTLARTGANMAFRLALGHPNAKLIFQNPDDRALFVQNRMITEARTQVIKGSGVDMNVFHPEPETDGDPVVLFAGRLLWKKGLGVFVDAAERLKKMGVKARFVVVGYPEPSSPAAVPMSQLETWAKLGLIEWWGKRDDMPAVFAASHVVCLPSSYGEGIPKVLIEAAACGRAVVTTDTPGCREITRQGENGLLVPKDDPAALADAIRQLVEDSNLRRAMGACGRQIAANEFSETLVFDQTFSLYRVLLNQGRSM